MTQTNPTRTRSNRETDVKPSAPGSVDAWLDMLVSMLALPRQERERVRDELEDHLRSRIDDLLITGLTEPEALKQAASELGETADLARQLTHAHGPSKKRTYAMHAALFALAGSIAAIGISLSGGGSNPNTVNGIPVVSGVPVVAMAEDGHAHASSARVDLRDTTLGAVIGSVKSMADRPVLVHWDVLGEYGIGADHVINFDVDPLPHHLVHDLLIEHFERELGDDTLAMDESEDLFEISLRSHFDSRSTERKTYDLSEFVPVVTPSQGARDGQQPARLSSSSRDALHDVQQAILSHVESPAWAQRGGDRAAMSLVGASLVITAPERLHEQVGALLNDLRTERLERQAVAQHEALKRAERLRAEYDMLVKKRFALGDQVSHVGKRLEMLDLGNAEGKSMNEMVQEASELKAMLERLDFQSKDIEQRIEYLRFRLINAEYASIS